MAEILPLLGQKVKMTMINMLKDFIKWTTHKSRRVMSAERWKF